MGAREEMKKAAADALRSVLEEGKATVKTTGIKKKYTEATKNQIAVLKDMAKTQLAVIALQEDLTKIQVQATKENFKRALSEKQVIEAQKESKKIQLKLLESQRIAIQTQEDLNRKKEKERIVNLKSAQARQVNAQIIKEETTAREKELAALKRSIIERSKEGVQLKGIRGAMSRLLGVHSKLAKATMFSTRNLRNFNSSSKSLGSSLSKLRSKLLIVSFGVGLVQRSIQGLVSEYAKYQGAQARVNATLTSTGHASGQSVKGLSQLAAEIQKNTGVSDTFTLSSSALLTTFTAIGGETFPTAQKAIVDMTAAMNAGQVTQEGLKSSTIQVGKALNAPIKGLTSLSRVGVLFTKKQKDLIKSHVNAGNVAKAQAIILKELNKEFGNTASADSYEKSVRLLESTIGDLQKEIGLALLPTFELLIDFLSSSVEWTMANKRAVFEYAIGVGIAIGALKAYSKWLALTVLATEAGTTAVVQLRIAMNSLFTKTILGAGLLIIVLMVQKIVEMSGAFKGLDKSVIDATNQLIKFNNVSDAIGKHMTASRELDKINESLGKLPNSIEVFGTFKEKWGKVFIAVGRGRKEIDGIVPQVITLADGFSFTATTAGEAAQAIFDHRIELEQQGLTQKEIIKQTQIYIDNLDRIKATNISEEVENTTKKYQNQLAVLKASGQVNKELVKVSQDVFENNTELTTGLDAQKAKYNQIITSQRQYADNQKRISELNVLQKESVFDLDAAEEESASKLKKYDAMIERRMGYKKGILDFDHKSTYFMGQTIKGIEKTIANEKEHIETLRATHGEKNKQIKLAPAELELLEKKNQAILNGIDLSDEQIASLKLEIEEYEGLKNAIKAATEEKQKTANENKFVAESMSFLTGILAEESSIQQSIMQSDIEAAKKTSEYKLAQKQGDEEKMAQLEKAAAAKSLASRQTTFLAEKGLAAANVIIQYQMAIARGFGEGGAIFGIPLATAMKIQMAMALALIAKQTATGMPKFAQGGDFTTTGPQMIMVGDNPGGRERVQVTPLSSPNIAGPQGGGSVTVNVSGNVLSQDFVEGELAENIKEAIRRGTDFGIS